MGFVEDLASLLTTAGLGAVGTSIFYSTRSSIPSEDGPYISLIETTGFADVWIQNDKTRPAFERPGAQIVVRAARYIHARDKIVAVDFEIRQMINRFIGQHWYKKIHVMGRPWDAGNDEEKRAMLKLNVWGERSPFL